MAINVISADFAAKSRMRIDQEKLNGALHN